MIALKFRKRSGFTIVELIGVMAILAILASFAVPAFVKQIDQARLEEEGQNLVVLGEALQRHIIGARTVPKDAGAAGIAEELGVAIGQITATASGRPRVFLSDPEMILGSDPAVLPYTQTINGSPARPENVRIMIVSSHGLDLPDLAAQVAAVPEAFDELWDTPEGSVPAGWPSEWSGRGGRLLVCRLDLSPLFYRLIVNNLTSGVEPVFSIDDGDTYQLTASAWSTYYFQETAIGFYNNGQLAGRDLLMDDRSYVYERGQWRGRLRDGKADQSSFALALDAFLSSRLNGGSPPGVTQQAVAGEYHHFALAYATWAHAGFPGPGSPENQAVVDARNALQEIAGLLIQP